MRNRIHHLGRDERGMSFVFVGIGFTAFLAATTLAIDVGMFMNARTQAQNAADAGALAGVTALVFNDYNNRTSSGPAVQSAVNAATVNKVIGTSPSVAPADVTFPAGPTGQANRVQVNVYRTASRGNPVPALMGALFGVRTVDIGATATAEASPANAVTCVKPFTIPDRWVENRDPPWAMASTFDRYYTSGPNKGQVMTPADAYPTAYDAGYNGYSSSSDIGKLLTIRAGTGDNVEPTMYYSWAMPGSTGGDDYRGNISGCNPTMVKPGDLMTQEPGNMVGPTIQGIDDLIAQDPNAHWDTACNCVKGSALARSPRVFPIPLYDPDYYQSGKVNGRTATLKVANWLGFFVVSHDSNNIYGRVTPILGIIDATAGTPPGGAFPKAIRLVQ